jgi:uncharacterized protein with HEPN domain
MQPALVDEFIPIFDAINLIDGAMAWERTANFCRNKFCQLATERAFEVISAASRRIPSDVKMRQPEIDWQRLAVLDRHLRDKYYKVNSDMLLQIPEHDLPLLKALAERVIREAD